MTTATLAPAWFYAADAEQIARFETLRRRFADLYLAMKTLPYQEWVVPFWSRMEQHLEARLLPEPPLDFLCDDYVRGMMFVFGGQADFERKLRTVRTLPAVAADPRIAREDRVGAPEILGSETYLVRGC